MYMYVDSNGNVHTYTFYQTASGYCIVELIENTILKIQKKGCPASQDIQMGMHDT